ncbi:unnamed protein product [Pedinophyceae sp. YPF-701]|nr:unnamed protein product [Pedinophyceae sp. YPF-701]
MAKTVHMKGLKAFIEDIRNCQNKDQEMERIEKELANIRVKFKKGAQDGKTMSAYDKKKYVWKLLYIRMLGYPVEFGHMQALELISAPRFAEKQVGYMALETLLHESHDFLRIAINSIKSDLNSMSEAFQCLALSAAANLGNREFAESLTRDVERILQSPGSRPVVKKKAALCLVKMLRKAPEIPDRQIWARNLPSMLTERDIGLLLCYVELLQQFVVTDTAGFEPCVSRLAQIMQRLAPDRAAAQARDDRAGTLDVMGGVPREYTYYGIPSPWLQCAVLRVLQYFDLATLGGSAVSNLNALLEKIITIGQNVRGPVGKQNGFNAVLFEAMALATSLETDGDGPMVQLVVSLLGKFVSGADPNTKYLALDYMGKLSMIPAMQDALARNQEAVLALLAEPDASIRRRVVDLAVILCDARTVRVIVHQLLAFMDEAEHSLRDELALKIAILAERYAPDLHWYVDTLLELLQRGGEFVGEDIWFRVVQIATNNPDLQPYAARAALEATRAGSQHPDLVKLAAYLLGEFSGALNPPVSPGGVFSALHEHFHAADNATRAILLTAYAKLVAKRGASDPALQRQVVDVLKGLRVHEDVELQQRATEYLALLERGPATGPVAEAMPAFPDRVSGLLKRLAKVQGTSGDGGGGFDDAYGVEEATSAMKALPAPSGAPTQPLPALESDVGGAANGASAGGGGDDLLGLDDDGGAVGAAGGAAGGPSAAQVAAWRRKMFGADSGVVFEDGVIQVGLKSLYSGAKGKLALFVGNKTPQPLSGATCEVETPPGWRGATLQPLPAVVPASAQVQTHIGLALVDATANFPAVTLAFDGPAGRVVRRVELPVPVTKFITPDSVSVDQGTFFQQWGGAAKAQAMGANPGGLDRAKAVDVLARARLRDTDGIEHNPANVVGCGTLVTESAPQGVRVLVRIEIDPATGQRFRLTVGAATETAASAVQGTLEELLANC